MAHRPSSVMAHVCSTEFWIFQSQGSLASSREIEPEEAARGNVISQMLCTELDLSCTWLWPLGRRRVQGVREDGWAVSDPDYLYFGYMEAKQSVLHLSRGTQHSYPPDLYDDPEAHQFIARTHLFGAWDQMRK